MTETENSTTILCKVTKIEKEGKHTFLIQIGLGLYILQIYYLVVKYKLRLERDTMAFNVNV